ncbi:unnamed protein product [Cylicocyclus nassatus]|uniref:Uncharacterized protein n=1 Tax=Cylicocyclus nassatus TaxID=53992 RepID=A0AA36GH77_CYLNA|nr:unnamed protein product [Cylicocyclus nassatus]
MVCQVRVQWKEDVSLCELRDLRMSEWKSVKHQMKFMKGYVTKIESKNCCTVEWDNGWRNHAPQSAHRLATSE